MAISAYTGPPGAGKSYALVSQVIVPGVIAGRRVVTNIDGIDPDKVHEYCADKAKGDVGEVVLFGGWDATKPGFFPTEDIPDTATFIKGGDLIVFDEWRLYWPRRGKQPTADLEGFLRWHRHLVNDKGHTCDVIIGTQLATDLHTDYRGLVERTFKFRKLSSLGMKKTYQYDVYEGHLQSKGSAYQKGNGRYKKEIFALYSSFSGGADGVENSTDSRTTIWSKWVMIIGLVVVLMLGVGIYGVYSFFTQADVPKPPSPGQTLAPGQVAAPVQVQSNRSPYRIVGQLVGDSGVLVVLTDGSATRLVDAEGFEFANGRPVSGLVDGREVIAEDRVVVTRGKGIIELPDGAFINE